MEVLRELRPDFAALDIVHARIDQALADNRRAEQQLVWMANSIFVMGLLGLLIGYRTHNTYMQYGAGILSTLLFWPMYEIRRLRRDNIVLQAFPILITRLSGKAAEQEIQKLLAYLRGERPERNRKRGGTK